MILASVYSSHKHRTEERLKQLSISRQGSLDYAFTLLLTAESNFESGTAGSTAAVPNVVRTRSRTWSSTSTQPQLCVVERGQPTTISVACFHQFVRDYAELAGLEQGAAEGK